MIIRFTLLFVCKAFFSCPGGISWHDEEDAISVLVGRFH